MKLRHPGSARGILGFRHTSPFARTFSAVVAGLVALLLVMGPGSAYAEESAPASTETPAPPPAPVEEPPSAPVTQQEEPAPAPVEEPAGPSAPAEPTETPGETPPAPEPEVEETDPAQTPAAPAPSAKSNLGNAIIEQAFAAIEPADAAITVPCVGGPGTVVGGFEIDGNICAQGNLDWATTGLYWEDGLGDSTTFHGGNSEGDDPAGWTGGGPTPNGKTDIGDVWAYSHVSGGSVYGYFALTNDSTSGGTSQYDLEYNQQDNIAAGSITRPNRTPGDLLFRFSSSGSDPIVFTDAKKWVLKTDGAWGAGCQSVTTTAGWCTIPIPAGAFAQSVNATGTFFEGAINISLLIGEGNCSGNFGVVQFRSVTGGSFYSSSLKDYVKPLGVTTPSTCGSIVIEKNDLDGNPLGGATFSVTPNPDPNADDFTPYSITDNDDQDKNPADGIIEINPVDPGVEYTVTETAAPTGYLLPVQPSQGPAYVAESGSVTFTFEDPRQWQALTAEKTAVPSYTAEYAWSIVKEISATGDAPWSAATTEGSPLVTTIPATADPTVAPLYYRVKVTEGARTTSAYAVGGNISVTNPNDAAVTADISDSLPGATCLVEGEATATVDVPAEDTTDYAYVCTFAGIPDVLDGTNTATISWDKSDYPQQEGDQAAEGDYEISPSADYEFGDETTAVDKTVTVTDDQYEFPGGWTIDWTAEDNETVSDVYEIDHSAPAGDCSEVLANTATITGDEDVLGTDTAYGQLCAELPTLTLVKEVVNGKGGEASAQDWTLTATPVEIEGQDPVTGNGDPTDEDGISQEGVFAGDYTLSESDGPEGYSQVGGWDCGDAVVTGDVVTVEYGADVTCTVTNQQDAVWTLAKSSDPADGTVQPGDEITYTLTATLLAGVAATDLEITDDYSGLVGKTSVVQIDDPDVTMNGDDTFTWSIDSLEDEETLDYTVTVNEDAIGVELVNLVTAPDSTCPPTPEVEDARQAVTEPDDCTVVHHTPEWTLEKSSDPESGSIVSPGDVITYTLTVTNISDALVNNMQVTDDLSRVLDTATLNETPDGVLWTIEGTTLTWNVPDLAPGEVATLTYSVTLDEDEINIVQNVAVPVQVTGRCVTVDGCATGHTPEPLPPEVIPPPEVSPPGLPDTGGPDQQFLMVGLALLLAGLGLVLVGRRRSRV